MYCINCGQEVNSSANFCNQCGARQNFEKNDLIKSVPSEQFAKGSANKSKVLDNNDIGFKLGYWYSGLTTKNKTTFLIFILALFVIGFSNQFGSNVTSNSSSDSSKEQDQFLAYCSSYPLYGGFTLGGNIAEKLGKNKVRQWCFCGYSKTKEKMNSNEIIQVLSGELGSVDPIYKKFGNESMNAIASCVEQDELTKSSEIAKSLVGLLRSQGNLFKL